MAILAITNIEHGNADGTVKTFGIGDSIVGLDEDQVRNLVIAGAAVETGSKRKFSSLPVVREEDEDTLKRDALILKAASDGSDEGEAVTHNSDPAAKLAAAGRGASAAPGGPGAQNPQGPINLETAPVQTRTK